MKIGSLILIIAFLVNASGCATIDSNERIVDAECALKNSVPGIHDAID